MEESSSSGFRFFDLSWFQRRRALLADCHAPCCGHDGHASEFRIRPSVRSNFTWVFLWILLIVLASWGVRVEGNNTRDTIISSSRSQNLGNGTASVTIDLYNSTSETKGRLYSYRDLGRCNLTSLQLRHLGAKDTLTPCILQDLQPDATTIGNSSTNNNTTEVAVLTVVMVTNHACSNHRDGAHLAVQTFNRAGGIRIGFYKTVELQFRFVSVIAGNSDAMTANEYDQQHQSLLESTVQTLQPYYIIGTCSPLAHNEKEIALRYQTILMAAVGPPSYYAPSSIIPNPWLFGIHLDSDVYTVDSVRRLQFWAQQQGTVQTQPVRVIYRTSSEFFFSTCQAAIDRLAQAGFENITPILYDPAADHDEDGIPNELDVDFLHQLADQACPARTSLKNGATTNSSSFHPALFMCTRAEHGVLLERLRANQCLPVSLWLTAATWTWAFENKDQVPYVQGGTQWHEALTYQDEWFDSGAAVIAAVSQQFGYPADADAVVHYSIPMLFANHLQSAYRTYDDPDPVADFANPEGREFLRRVLQSYEGNTIFGPVAFDHRQRNHARGAASSQWLPTTSSTGSSSQSMTVTENSVAEDITTTAHGDVLMFRNALVAPIVQAEAAGVVPVPSALPCSAGSYVNGTRIQRDRALLANKCSLCPAATFTSAPTSQWECNTCPVGSHTNQSNLAVVGGDGGDHVGATNCLRHEQHLLSGGLLAFAYLVMGATWLLGSTAIAWVCYYRKDAIVRLAQIEFLILICVGAIISSSSILPLTFQAGIGQDTTMATRGCRAAPFLYTLGWTLQYGSLMAKTYRLYRVMREELRRVRVTALQSAWLVAIVVAIDFAIVLTWTLVSPLEYVREITGTAMEGNVETIESVGRCRPPGHLSVWTFVAPIFIHHVLLITVTNLLLCLVRDVNDRYQEQKFMAMAAVFVLETVVVGLPVLIAAKDSYEATFVVLVSIIGLADIGLLSLIFVPKVLYQRKGLEEGVGVGESIMRQTHQKAVDRESSRRISDLSQTSRECPNQSLENFDTSPTASESYMYPMTGAGGSRIPARIEEGDEENCSGEVILECTQLSTDPPASETSPASVDEGLEDDDESEEENGDTLLFDSREEAMLRQWAITSTRSLPERVESWFGHNFEPKVVDA